MVFPWFPCIFRVFLYVLLRVPGKATAGQLIVPATKDIQTFFHEGQRHKLIIPATIIINLM